MNFSGCTGLVGTLVTLPPPSMKTFNIRSTGMKIDVVAIEWPEWANATALVHDDSELVCRTTDQDESKEGAESIKTRIGCESEQVIGDIGKLVLPGGMQEVNFAGCRGLTGNIGQLHLPVGTKDLNFLGCEKLTGDLAQLQLPVGMQDLNLGGCRALTGDLTQLHLPVGMKDLNLWGCKALTGDITQMNLPEGMQTVNFVRCARLTGKLPASERAKVKNYRGP